MLKHYIRITVNTKTLLFPVILMQESFCESYNLTSLIKQPTCFKNLKKPSCIDLILTSKPKSFQSRCVTEAGWPDSYRMIVSIFKKIHFRKLPSSIISYKVFSNMIMQTLLKKVLCENEIMEYFLKDPDYFL